MVIYIFDGIVDDQSDYGNYRIDDCFVNRNKNLKDLNGYKIYVKLEEEEGFIFFFWLFLINLRFLNFYSKRLID